jgi:diguanylate cyclase (GGDEF)-like protein
MESGIVLQTRGRYAVVRGVRTEQTAIRVGQTLLLADLPCGEVLRTRTTIACASLADAPELALREAAAHARLPAGAYLGIPILVNDEPYGVISFSSALPRPGAFTPHEIEIAELMAKGVARSIFEHRTRSERRRVEMLEQDRNTVLEMVAQNQPLEEILQRLVRLVERQSPALCGSVILARQGHLYCVAAPGMPARYRERLQGFPFVDIPGCCFSAARQRQTVIFEGGAPQCCADNLSACIHEYCWQAAGAAPILSGSGEVLGIFSTYYRMAQQPRRVDTELLTMAARLAAIAIEHRLMTDQLAFQAHHDTLTGLVNRSRFSHLLDVAISHTSRQRRSLGVLFIDLDRFKQINDRFGHSAGDALLRETAARIKDCLEPGDVAARFGGDEFAVLLANVNSHNDALRRSQRFLEALRAPFLVNGVELFVTASIGVSQYPRDAAGAGDLLAKADLAMYRVKHHGKNDVLSFTPALTTSIERLELEHSLTRALENHEFRLVYQPQVELDGSLAGLEALLAWHHPRLGRVPPGEFISIAEDNGMIVPIGSWVLREACFRNAAWQSAGYPPVKVAVNVSPLQFARADFVDTVADALAASGLDPVFLELEITESLVMRDFEESIERIGRLRTLGVSVSIDDFGTGYSSLAYLRRLPADTLKIDQSFLRDSDSRTTSLIGAITALAHDLGLMVVGEGVETPQQLEILKQAGCDKAQGHLFGGPLAPEAVERLLSAAR